MTLTYKLTNKLQRIWPSADPYLERWHLREHDVDGWTSMVPNYTQLTVWAKLNVRWYYGQMDEVHPLLILARHSGNPWTCMTTLHWEHHSMPESLLVLSSSRPCFYFPTTMSSVAQWCCSDIAQAALEQVGSRTSSTIETKEQISCGLSIHKGNRNRCDCSSYSRGCRGTFRVHFSWH